MSSADPGKSSFASGTAGASSSAAATLRVITRADFETSVRNGAKWVLVDGNVVDVSVLQEDDGIHKGGPEVLQVGADLTDSFKFFHANLPKQDSLHSSGQTVMEHIRDKIVANIVAVLDTHSDRVALSNPEHSFWHENDNLEEYHEMVKTSLAVEGIDTALHIAKTVAGLPPDSVRSRAFWAIIGSLVADAAAVSTHWCYKTTYFHDELKKRGRWETPEFMRPVLNPFYHLPIGSQSNYCDQSVELLRSLVNCKGLDMPDVEQRFAKRFAEDYESIPENRQSTPVKGHWRHGSLTGFIKNVRDGRHWPECGTSDKQADCFVRIVPVVALYAGRPDLLERVTDAVRVTQDNPECIAIGQTFARILEQVILHGANGSDALSLVVSDLAQQGLPIADVINSAVNESSYPLDEAVLKLSGGHFSVAKVA